MKSTWSKIPAMIAMTVSTVSLGLMIAALVAFLIDNPDYTGKSDGFGLWILGVIVAYFSMVFYCIDALICLVKAYMNIDRKANILLSIMLIVAIPMMILVGGKFGIEIFIWNAYYLAILIVEIKLLIRHFKANTSEYSSIT